MTNNFDLNKFNDLISKATDAILCNSECQKQRQSEILKQNYLNAKTNLATAPQQETTAEKNYIIFTQGKAAYNDLLDKKLLEKANIITEKFKENFNQDVNKINSQIESYNGLLINFTNIIELYLQYKEENIELVKKFKYDSNDILTNERKSFYEEQNVENLNFFYFYFLIIIYIILIICFQIFYFFYPTNLNLKFKILISVFFIILPFISTWLLELVLHFLQIIYDILPKNVYKEKNF